MWSLGNNNNNNENVDNDNVDDDDYDKNDDNDDGIMDQYVMFQKRVYSTFFAISFHGCDSE